MDPVTQRCGKIMCQHHLCRDCYPQRIVPTCKGSVCDKGCDFNTGCQYKSSADEAREVLERVTLPAVRTFETGANRDVDTGKLDYEGFLSPSVLKRFAEYMHKNRTLRDGSLRDSDNWQKGIPKAVYMKSMWRHFFDVWSGHRKDAIQEEDLCALLFNVQGMLHEVLK